jgi:TolA-binding protein
VNADPCYAREGERVSLQKGEKRSLTLAPHVREAAIDVKAEDDQGNALEAAVTVDGTSLGNAPGVFKLPLCARDLTVATAAGLTFSRALSLKERETQAIKAVLTGRRALSPLPVSQRKVVRPRALLAMEIKQLEGLRDTTDKSSPDRRNIELRIADAYDELAESAALDETVHAGDASEAEKLTAHNVRVTSLAKAARGYADYAKSYPDERYADRALYQSAVDLAAAHYKAEARKALLEVIQKYPQSEYVPWAYIQSGDLFLDEGKPELAAQAYREAAKHPKTQVVAQSRLALVTGKPEPDSGPPKKKKR